MHFQCPSSCHDDSSIRIQTRHTTLDVAKLLHAHVSTEATLGEDVADAVRGVTLLRACELERDTVSEYRGVSVRNVREGAGVDKDRRALQNNIGMVIRQASNM